MDIDIVLGSASCDLKISQGHQRNNNIEGMRACITAAVNRIDAVITFCDDFNIEWPYKLNNMIKFSTDLYDDLIDSETMVNYFNSIKDLPNARTEELI